MNIISPVEVLGNAIYILNKKTKRRFISDIEYKKFLKLLVILGDGVKIEDYSYYDKVMEQEYFDRVKLTSDEVGYYLKLNHAFDDLKTIFRRGLSKELQMMLDNKNLEDSFSSKTREEEEREEVLKRLDENYRLLYQIDDGEQRLKRSLS